jgi:hypothetical protein
MTGDFLYIKYRTKNELYNNSAFIFLKNQFENFQIDLIENNALISFSNQNNFSNNLVFYFGTIIYKNKYNDEAISLLLKEDFNVNWNNVLGNYVILDFRKKEQIYIDPLRKYHVFSNKEEGILSSSFLAVCHASNILEIDRISFHERLLRGYNIAPDTLYKNIKQIYYQENCNINLQVNHFINNGKQKKWKNKKEVLTHQKQALEQFISKYKPIIEEEGGDLGLSGGYDSRLLLSVFKKLNFKNIQLHSHAINGVKTHASERIIAKKLALKTNYKFKVFEIEPFTELSTLELEKHLIDNWQYFDGRNSHNMGSLAPNYNSFYKKEIMANLKVSMNGIGGETYRNYYKIGWSFSRFMPFVENHLFYRFSKFFIPQDDYKNVVEKFKQKVNKRLQLRLNKTISLKEIRRYYNEVRMPDGDANNNNAHNKYFNFLTPFIEPQIILSTNKIEKYLGVGGKFEGNLIASFNSELASIPTSYGKSANSIGFFKEMINQFKAFIPQQISRYRYDYVYKKNKLDYNQTVFKNKLIQKSKFVNNYWENIEKLFPEVNWKAVNTDFASLANANMMAITLYEFRQKTNKNE